MSVVELKRLFQEWRIRVERARQILQPPSWTVEEWNRFARALALVIHRYGTHWQTDATLFWDIRWDLQDGGCLICQLEEIPGEKRALVVAQQGGFSEGHDNYTWFYAEFGQGGEFLGQPYWVDGNWKDALAMILLPQQMAAGFYLADSPNGLPLGLTGGETSRPLLTAN
ncbi:MAG: hypothetical protein SNJ84_01680 [Verrucomicrobiia bacterium]